MKKSVLTILLIAAVTAIWAQKPDKKTVKLEKQLVGTFEEIPDTHYTIEVHRKDTTETITRGAEPFRMLQTEVTIASYNRFLEDLKAQGRMAEYEKAQIDTSRAMPDIAPFYFTHPAYGQYPVTCVSHEGAMLFCRWLTEKAGGGEWEYTLPTEEEWKCAAQGGKWPAQYSMGGPLTTNNNGVPLYTYLHVDDSHITMQDGHLVIIEFKEIVVKNSLMEKKFPLYRYKHPTHVYSHHPNLYGLYNMCGNVAEMVYECGVAFGGSFLDPGYDIRIDSEKRYDAPSQLIGFRVIARRKK